MSLNDTPEPTCCTLVYFQDKFRKINTYQCFNRAGYCNNSLLPALQPMLFLSLWKLKAYTRVSIDTAGFDDEESWKLRIESTKKATQN